MIKRTLLFFTVLALLAQPMRVCAQTATYGLTVNADGTLAKPTTFFTANATANAASVNSIVAPAWTNITSKPTTVSGYGITNGATIDSWGTKSVPTGTVVGISDTQTLTNKTLTSPVINGPSGITKSDVGLGNVLNVSSAWVLKSTTYSAAAGDNILADTTSAAFTITLPASPSVGDVIQFSDAQGTWSTNNLTVGRNGNLIMASASNLTCSTTGANFSLVWVAGATGWRILQ